MCNKLLHEGRQVETFNYSFIPSVFFFFEKERKTHILRASEMAQSEKCTGTHIQM